MSLLRESCLREIADHLAAQRVSHPLRVAVDGRTACGKTTFADALARHVAARGRAVIRTSIDGFHRPKAQRYARGRYSAQGYYYDARDLDAVRRFLLDPLGPGGDRHYRTASFELENDKPIEQLPQVADTDSILLVDGTFLQRPELQNAWDVVLFIDVAEEVALAHGVQRDRTILGGSAHAPEMYEQRYCPAFDIYDAACHPRTKADIIIDNNDFAAPAIVIAAIVIRIEGQFNNRRDQTLSFNSRRITQVSAVASLRRLLVTEQVRNGDRYAANLEALALGEDIAMR